MRSRSALVLLLAPLAIFGAVTAAGIHGAWLGAAAVGLTILMVRRPLWGAFVVVLLFTTLCIMPLYSRAGPAAWRAHCANNLRQVGIAFYNYHDVYQSLPPAHVADEAGQPVHSWRILVTPFVEYQRVYDRYDFREPWDGPDNRRIAPEIPFGYRCLTLKPAERDGWPMTSYLALVGSHTAFPGAQARRLDAIAHPAETIIVVESFEHPVPWPAPEDISVDEAAIVPPAEVSLLGWWLRLEPARDASYHSLSGRNALFADGSVRLLPLDLSPDDFRALADIRDVPKPSLEAFPPVPPLLRQLAIDPSTVRWAGFFLALASLTAMGFALARRRHPHRDVARLRPEDPILD